MGIKLDTKTIGVGWRATNTQSHSFLIFDTIIKNILEKCLQQKAGWKMCFYVQENDLYVSISQNESKTLWYDVAPQYLEIGEGILKKFTTTIQIIPKAKSGIP